jgi:PAS domain S-box-containing protein
LIGFLTLIEYLFAINLGIDQILFKELPGALYASSPNRMAITAAIAFILIGPSLLFLSKNTPKTVNWSQIMALIAIFVMALPLIGFLYGTPQLYYIPNFTGVAIYVALLLLWASLSILFARPDQGFVSNLTSNQIGSYFTRRILPILIIFTIGIGLIIYLGGKAGLYDTSFGLSILILSTLLVYTLIFWWFAIKLNKTDFERDKAEEQIQRLANVVMSSDDAIISKTLEGVIKTWNKGAEHIYGYSSEEVVGKNISILAPNHLKEERKQLIEKIKDDERVLHYETTRIRKDGKEITISVSLSPLFDTSGNLIGISTIARDITDHKKAEIALRLSQLYNRSLIEASIDPLVTISPEGKITDVNEATVIVTGVEREKLIGTDFSNYFTDPKKAKTGYQQVFKDNMVRDYDLEIRKVDGDITPVLYNASVYLDDDGEVAGVFAAARDISQLKKAEEVLKEHLDNLEITVEKRTNELTNANVLLNTEIKERKKMGNEITKSLEEKEMLLKEIHHRVKNNLMIISSLLNLQSSYIKDKASQDIFKESQNRARSMALIHERLYQSTDLKRIDFGEYITSLTTELFHTYVADPSLIELKIKVDNIFLDINTAIPLGLIVNELITNSLKHAFPKGMKGEIIVDFHPIDDHYEFTVKDNGIGFPEDIDYQNTDSLGLQIVNSLTDQIDGEIELDRNNGTEFKITFKDLDYNG